MSKILFSSYFCNPYLTSEAYAAFSWLTILLKKYNVILLTSEESKNDFLKYYKNSLPDNLELIGVCDKFPFKNKIHKRQFYIGYFVFNRKAYKLLKRSKELQDSINVVFHKSPSSFRYFSSLHKLKAPFVIGPLGGGLPTPPELKNYFKDEKLLNKLRVFDKLLLKLPVFRKQFSRADNIFITLDYLRERFQTFKPKKITTILDTGINVKNNFTLNRNNDIISILYVGKLIKPKGAEFLVKAFSNLLKIHNNIELHIVGDGPEKDRLATLIDTLSLNKKAFLHGNLPFEKVSEHYLNSNIFCFPSIKEASGNVLFETMKHKLPIVTVNNGGPKYMCPDSGTFKVKIGDEEHIINQLTEYLNKLIVEPEMRIKMGEENYKYCLDNFDWEILEKRIINIFKEYFNGK